MLFLYLLHPPLLWSLPLFAFNISPCTLCGMNKEGCLFYDWELWGGKKQAPEMSHAQEGAAPPALQPPIP